MVTEPSLAVFAKLYLGISVSIVEGSDKRTRADLVRGNVVVLGDPVKVFDAIPISSEQLVARLPKHTAMSARLYISPSDFDSRPFVMTLAGSEPIVLGWFEASGTVPNIKHRLEQTHSILKLVRAGMGAAIVTSLSLPDNHPDVTVKPLRPTTKRQIHVVKKTGLSNSKAVDIFWNFLGQTISEEGAF